MIEIVGREDIEQLEAKIDNLTMLLHKALDTCQIGKVVSIADICKVENISRSQITGKERYLLPNFGVSDYPDGTMRWNIETYMNWQKIPPVERKKMYSKYLDNLRLDNLKKEGINRGIADKLLSEKRKGA